MMAKKPAGNDAGYYGGDYSKAELADLDHAQGKSLAGEIGMLRIMMRRFFNLTSREENDLDKIKNALQLLGLSCTRLARVIQTENSLQGDSADELSESLHRAMSTVLEEMGSAGLDGHGEGAQDG